MRYLATITATSMLLAIGLTAATAGEPESVSSPATGFEASGVVTGRSAFTPSGTSLPAERPIDSAMVPTSMGSCSQAVSRDRFGNAYRACAVRVINPTESDELAFSVSLTSVGFKLVSSDVFAMPQPLDTLGFAEQILPAERFTVPAATASR